MTFESLARKLKACLVPHETRSAFLRLYEEAEGDSKAKQILLDNRRMATQHIVEGKWGPVSRNKEGNLRPAPSPLRATSRGRLLFSSPEPQTPSATFQHARATLFGPDFTRSFQHPGNGAYKKSVTSSQKKAIRAQRLAFEHVAAQSAQQQAYVRALEEALEAASRPNVAPVWVASKRFPGAFLPGLSWDRLKGSPAHVVATLTGFPSYEIVEAVFKYLDDTQNFQARAPGGTIEKEVS
jgi:hypothetical protein